jgi:glycosyltransferase involved in cell wall biosynthesis
MISVIVPIYNVNCYLPSCLNSIVSQSFKDLEIILVDDGSTDGSSSICDDYACRDSRVRVIHQDNKGVVNARNVGLKEANGDYIIFTDSDDVLHPQMIDTLYSLILSGDYDFSMCYGETVYTAPDSFSPLDVITNKKSLSQDTLLRYLFVIEFAERLQYQVLWNKLYKRQLLKNLFFTQTSAEDQFFNTQVYLRTNLAILICHPLYYWMQHSSSMTHQELNNWWIAVIDSLKLCLDAIPKDNSIYRAYCLRRLYKRLLSTLSRCKNSSLYIIAKEKIEIIQKQTLREFLTNKTIPLLDKYIYLVCRYCPFVYQVVIYAMGFRTRRKKFVMTF